MKSKYSSIELSGLDVLSLSRSVIPTQFGHIPDIAFEEIKQIRAQQSPPQQPGPLPYSTPTFGGPSPASNSPAQAPASLAEPLSNANRTTSRDLSINHLNGIVRSRSLAANSTARPAVAPVSSNANGSAYQTSLFPSNKSTYLPPTRFGLNRLMSTGAANAVNPPLPTSSAMSYASNRSLPISTQPNIKPRPGNHHQPSTSINPDPQRPHYETTYRSSFIKPLAP